MLDSVIANAESECIKQNKKYFILIFMGDYA